MNEFLSNQFPTVQQVGKIDAGLEDRIALSSCIGQMKMEYEQPLITNGLLHDTDNDYEDYGHQIFNGTLKSIASVLPNELADENYTLFPQLEDLAKMEFNEEEEVDSKFFKNFTDIDEFITAIDDKKETSVPDFLDQYELCKDDFLVSDEVSEATKLLTKEQDEFADFIISSLNFDDKDESVIVPSSEKNHMQKISYLENESASSSPEVDDKTIDFLLMSGLSEVSEIIEECNVAPTETKQDNTPESELNNPEVHEQVINSNEINNTNCNSELSDDVLNEFVELLNSLDENSFNSVVAETENVVVANDKSEQNYNTNFQITFDLGNGNDNVLLLPIENVATPVNSSSVINYKLENVLSDSNNLKRKHSSVSSDDCSVLSPVSSIASDANVADFEDKTAFRRFKNNEAKRRCREKELFEREKELVKSNAELRVKTEVMQKEADLLRSLLINALSGSKLKQ